MTPPPRGAVIALLAAGLLVVAAPAAAADPSPGPPPGYDGLPYHNMPGRIGHQPGAYTWVLGFYLRPRRVLDAAGTSAMSNADLDSARYGLPNSRLGVEPTRRAWTGNAPGVRPDNPMDAVGSPDPAGGVKPATTMPGGAPGGLEDPAGAPKQPAVRSESSDPTPGGGIQPGSQNAGPEPAGSRR